MISFEEMPDCGNDNGKLDSIASPKISVVFHQDVRIILVPSRGEYKRNGICSQLWWGAMEFSQFQAMAAKEIKAYARVEGIEARAARRKLYQPRPEEIIYEDWDEQCISITPISRAVLELSGHVGFPDEKDSRPATLDMPPTEDDDSCLSLEEAKWSPRSVQHFPPYPVYSESPPPPRPNAVDILHAPTQLKGILKREPGTCAVDVPASASPGSVNKTMPAQNSNGSDDSDYGNFVEELTSPSPLMDASNSPMAMSMSLECGGTSGGLNEISDSAALPTYSNGHAREHQAQGDGDGDGEVEVNTFVSDRVNRISTAGCTPPPSLPGSVASSPNRTEKRLLRLKGLHDKISSEDLHLSEEETELLNEDLALMPALNRQDSLHCIKNMQRGTPVLPEELDEPRKSQTFWYGHRQLNSSTSLAKRDSDVELNADSLAQSASKIDALDPLADTLTLCVPLVQPGKLRPAVEGRTLSGVGSSTGLVRMLTWFIFFAFLFIFLKEKRHSMQSATGGSGGLSKDTTVFDTWLSSWGSYVHANANPSASSTEHIDL